MNASKIASELIRIARQITATGEPDQDYDKGTYDSIVAALGRVGYHATHKEFDKYQGVYLSVQDKKGHGATVWTLDSFVTGQPKPTGAKYRSATLYDQKGFPFTANKGDHFQLPPNHVFKGQTLVLITMDGKKKTIKNPKINDLPGLHDVRTTIEYKAEPDTVLVMWIEDTPESEKYHVRTSASTHKTDAAELIKGLKKHFAKK